MPKTKTPRNKYASYKKPKSLKEALPSPIKNTEGAIYGAGRGMGAAAARAAKMAYGNKHLSKIIRRVESQGVRRARDRAYQRGK